MIAVATWLASAGEEAHVEHHIDRTHSWIWPYGYEMLWGGIAAIAIIGALVWKAGPFVKKGLADRTARIQGELDNASQAQTDAAAEAADIRQAKGDIEAERARMLADADAQAEALIADGRRRLDAEVADLEAKADSDIAAMGARSGDELRAEIARLSSAAVEEVMNGGLSDTTHQDLIESYISRVGATGATAGARS